MKENIGDEYLVKIQDDKEQDTDNTKETKNIVDCDLAQSHLKRLLYYIINSSGILL